MIARAESKIRNAWASRSAGVFARSTRTIDGSMISTTGGRVLKSSIGPTREILRVRSPLIYGMIRPLAVAVNSGRKAKSVPVNYKWSHH